MPYGAKVAQNALWLVLATAGQKLVAFVSFIFVANFIGPELTGVFYYSISITSIFVILADLGMTPVVIRAVAGAREDGDRLLGAALRAKAVLAPLAIISALVYAAAFNADRVTLTTVAIACLVMTADTVHLVLYGVMRGRQNLRPEALGMFIGQMMTAVASILAAWQGAGPIGLAGALLIGSTWNVAWSLYQIRRLKISPARPKTSDYRALALEAIPFGIAGLAVKVYSYVDSLFIKQFQGAAAVGLYAVAYKLTYALQFLPLTFTAALYPALASAYANKQEEELRQTFLGSLRLMAAVSFPLSAGLSALAVKLIPAFYGPEFNGAIPTFTILPWVLLPIFLDFPIGSLLNATHRAHLKTTAMVVTMLINIVMNAVFVPRFGPLGAAWAGVVSFWALYLIGAWFTRREAGGALYFAQLTMRALLAAAISWYAWFVIAKPMPLVVSFVFGAAVSVLMAFSVRLVTVEDALGLWRRFRPSINGADAPHE